MAQRLLGSPLGCKRRSRIGAGEDGDGESVWWGGIEDGPRSRSFCTLQRLHGGRLKCMGSLEVDAALGTRVGGRPGADVVVRFDREGGAVG